MSRTGRSDWSSTRPGLTSRTDTADAADVNENVSRVTATLVGGAMFDEDVVIAVFATNADAIEGDADEVTGLVAVESLTIPAGTRDVDGEERTGAGAVTITAIG